MGWLGLELGRMFKALDQSQPAHHWVPTDAVLVHQIGPELRRSDFRFSARFRKSLGDHTGVIEGPKLASAGCRRCVLPRGRSRAGARRSVRRHARLQLLEKVLHEDHL